MPDYLLQNTLNSLHTNLIIVVVLGAVVVTFFYFKPKEMFKLRAFDLFMAVVSYCITIFKETVRNGSKQKDQMI